MKLYGVVTIDTECDRGHHWRNILPVSYVSVTRLVPEVLQKIFTRHGVKPTYLLSPEVLESRACVDTLKSLSHVELGSHLHGEFVDPGKRPLGEFTGEIQAQYTPELEEAKLTNLTRLFEEKIGYRPTSFRAGRWGMSPHTLKILESLSYLVDSSVTPYFMWKFPNYVLDYKTAIDGPYFPSRDNYLDRGHMRLLEVPVTLFSHYGRFIHKYASGFPFKKGLLKLPLWRPAWLRPTYSNFFQMKDVIDAYRASHRDQQSIILNMMFHSVEILPGENPYHFDQNRIRSFLDDMEKTFEYLHTLNTEFCGLSQVHSLFTKTGH